jgi:hypothetical protein
MHRRWLIPIALAVAAGAIVFLWPRPIAHEQPTESAPRAGAQSRNEAARDTAERPAAASLLPLPDLGRATLRIALVDRDGATLQGTVRIARPGEGASARRPAQETFPAPVADLGVAAGRMLEIRGSAAGHAPSSAVTLWLLPGEHRELTLPLGEGRTLRVRVIGPDQRAVAGAEVSVRQTPSPPSANQTPVAGGRTDASGEVQLAGLGAEPLEVTATAPGLCRRALELTDTDSSLAVTIALEAAQILSGLVVDAGGRPIDGAQVGALGSDENAAWLPGASTVQDGSFRLTDLAPGYYTLRASAPGFQSTTKAQVSTGAPGLRIELQRCAALTGTVRDARGATTEPYEIWIWRAQDSAGGVLLGAPIRQCAFTGDRPSFLIEDLAPGKVTLQARAPRGWTTMPAIDLLAAASAGPVDCVVEPGGRVTGSVRAEDGSVLVRLLPSDAPVPVAVPFPPQLPPRATLASAAGDWELSGVAAGRYLVEFLAVGHISERREVEVIAGGSARVPALTLRPAATLRVEVAEAARGESISLEIAHERISIPASEEGPGLFVFRDVEPGPWELRLYRAAREPSLLAPAPAVRRNLTLQAGTQTQRIE